MCHLQIQALHYRAINMSPAMTAGFEMYSNVFGSMSVMQLCCFTSSLIVSFTAGFSVGENIEGICSIQWGKHKVGCLR